ncbi:MAG: hypothetical protein DSY46_02475, partial [Hydrogenimonas sp.]
MWIQEYKNIKEQGFNFSPHFRCAFIPEYDGNRDIIGGELIVKENEDYIPNFFGENINVAAIIGKNGSGKSSVLEYLSKKPSFIVIFDNNKIIINNKIKNNISIKNFTKYQVIYEEINLEKCIYKIYDIVNL